MLDPVCVSVIMRICDVDKTEQMLFLIHKSVYSETSSNLTNTEPGED